MSAPAAEIVEKFQTAFGTGDIETAKKLVAPDCRLYEAPSLPYGGVYEGPAGFQKLCERVSASGEFALQPNVYLPIDDERALLRGHMKITNRETGANVDMPFLELYTVRDGLIEEVLVCYHDSAAVTATLRD
ncbi:nuclear transport factor 2 family protein [Amycolatopsis thermophila]|uniref:Ketosteroid isomerase-like protein n=1 Tax=Amycolatopsis thermophila TaxID=206084 RepID=A0ABU0F5C9_9PSEU|nr:nuclear transport factor 2 family protein [Amycolatopsis thermophila]MDQ0382737.1 ketosteroid isomerase-like protein [Amycolatopsis thermophila]